MNIKQFIDAVRVPENFRCIDHPIPHKYYVTAMQLGNLNGEIGWERYMGYVVQVRLKSGQFGSDKILIRHPDGNIIVHENQAFYEVSEQLLPIAESFFEEGVSPGVLDTDTIEYSIFNEYPATGLVVTREQCEMPEKGGSFSMMVSK